MKILIVDDRALARLVLIRAMEQAEVGDHEFTEAGDGLEALAHVQRELPDLILSDWRMPRMSGIELLEELNRLGVSVPFCLVTSGLTKEMHERARAADVTRIIAKPFTPETLADALRDLI